MTIETVVQRHLNALEKGDLALIMADYADDAVLMFPNRSLKGKAAIEQFFDEVITEYGAVALAGVKVLRQDTHANIVYVSWVQNEGTEHAMKGSDTYLIENDKIRVQAVYDAI